MDIREKAAQYYDLQDNPTHDVPFYLARLSSPSARVLELGCGTGRVLLPLTKQCGFIHGIDSSAAMLARCREKIHQAKLEPERVQVTLGDITQFDLGCRFDLIIAPFRVFQNLETEAAVDGLMRCIRHHLASSGTGILNTFNPKKSKDETSQTWCEPGERADGEKMLPDGTRLVRSHRRSRLKNDPLIVYPELIYRRYSVSGDLIDETIMPISMRCWYPDELEQLVIRNGFQIVGRWGGYNGEAWGKGQELVVQFGFA